MTARPNRQPEGIPTGGQFAAAPHAEPVLSLAPSTPRDTLRSDLAAAAEKHQALLQADWAESVWTNYPHAAFADVHIEGAENGDAHTAGVDLYDTEGIQIPLDMAAQAGLEDTWDAQWNPDRHRLDSRVAANLGPYSTAFSLDSVKERWDEMETAHISSTDPFAHLTGMERARAQSEHAAELNREATASYVQHISAKLLAINPDFGRLYVSRKADVESGLTFTLDRVEDIHRNVGDVDLSELEEYGFQDIHLDPFVDYDDATGDLYINLDPGD